MKKWLRLQQPEPLPGIPFMVLPTRLRFIRESYMVFYSGQGSPATWGIGPVGSLYAWTIRPRSALLVAQAASQANT